MLEFVKDSGTIQDILKDNNTHIEDFFKNLAKSKTTVQNPG